MAVEARWLLIVQRDRAHLLQSLQAQYPDATIILDRRKADRRRRSEPVPDERRRRQRRKSLALSELVMWESLGYRLVYRSGARFPSVSV